MERRGALALTVLAGVMWGTSFPANDLGLRDADPSSFLLARFAVGFGVVAALALATGGLDARPLRDPWVWAVAVANSLGYQLQFVGQTLTTPGKAALLVNAGNLAVPLFAALLLRERLRGARAPAVLLAAAGVALLGTEGSLANLRGGAFAGDLLALAAGLAWAAVIVLTKRAVHRGDALGITAWVLLLTALLALPAWLLGPRTIGAQGLEAAVYAGVLCTGVAFFLWTAALRHVSSVTSGLVLFLEIVVAYAVSLALGLERLSAWSLAGAACIVLAVLAVSLGGEPDGAAAPPAVSPEEPPAGDATSLRSAPR